MKRLILLAMIAAALLASTAASAATIGDLQAMGYTVGAASQCETPTHTWLTVWSLSGWGNSGYLSECDPNFQSTVDSWANPVAQCNRVWQHDHPDQLGALQSISGKGWSVTGDQCADTYTVTNPNDSTTAYSGSGSGLPGFNDSHGNPPAAPVGTPAPNGATTSPSLCLPLCPNVGDTRGGGGVLIPAPAPVTPMLAAATTLAVAAPPATVVDTSSYTVVAASAEETAATGVIGWLNTPYMTTPLVAPSL